MKFHLFNSYFLACLLNRKAIYKQRKFTSSLQKLSPELDMQSSFLLSLNYAVKDKLSQVLQSTSPLSFSAPIPLEKVLEGNGNQGSKTRAFLWFDEHVSILNSRNVLEWFTVRISEMGLDIKQEISVFLVETQIF